MHCNGTGGRGHWRDMAERQETMPVCSPSAPSALDVLGVGDATAHGEISFRRVSPARAGAADEGRWTCDLEVPQTNRS